ncbi:MAG: permease [Dethiobacteria bacterium]|jgi:uncharacterized membrane protein YraQ (UPF0718 family)
MNKTLLGMAAAALTLTLIAFFRGGFLLIGKCLWRGGQTFLEVLPLLLVAFVFAGLVSILVSKKMVSKWLGKEAGWKGPLLGSLMGAMVPGGPFFFYPLMATLITSGANIGTMISFVAAKTLWNVGRLPIEIAFVGVKITVIRFLITFAIPILVGTAVDIFLPGYAAQIREDVKKRQTKVTPPERVTKID